MLTYLLANWKQLGGVAVAAFAAGYVAHRCPQPAVHAVVDDKATQVGTSAAAVHKDEAPTRETVRKFARCPTTPGAPPAVVVERVIERGRVVTDTANSEKHANAEEHHLDLTITPQPRAGWALGVSLEGLPAGRDLRLSLRRRLLGPFWAEAAVQPATRALGVGLAVEW